MARPVHFDPASAVGLLGVIKSGTVKFRHSIANIIGGRSERCRRQPTSRDQKAPSQDRTSHSTYFSIRRVMRQSTRLARSSAPGRLAPVAFTPRPPAESGRAGNTDRLTDRFERRTVQDPEATTVNVGFQRSCYLCLFAGCSTRRTLIDAPQSTDRPSSSEPESATPPRRATFDDIHESRIVNPRHPVLASSQPRTACRRLDTFPTRPRVSLQD